MSYIYKITNKINNKIYIGETNRTIAIRWAQHKRRAKDSDNTEYLYCAMRKYGIENFEIEELEECNPEERFARETNYIIKYNSLAPNGYNLVLSQNGPTPLMMNTAKEYWDNGLSIVGIGNKLHMNPKTISGYLKSLGVTNEEIKDRRSKNVGRYSSKAVVRYTLYGEYVDEWDSASAAARELNYNGASISKSCKGNILTYKNYIWQYKESDDIENAVLMVKSKNKVGINEKVIQCFDLDHNFIKEYPSASAAGREFNVAHSGIAYAARNGTKAYGYYWKYKSEKESK